jgi:hypothetical protein
MPLTSLSRTGKTIPAAARAALTSGDSTPGAVPETGLAPGRASSVKPAETHWVDKFLAVIGMWGTAWTRDGKL